ncbi:MAG: hypothetical protein IJZ56_02790 [Oscillospiraceae bacterium]|nr:hypothetical protein [Oscillospiraceae bacterium]
MNTKKLLALVLVLAMIVCALPVVYAAATEDDTDISVDVEDLPNVTVIYGDADGDGKVGTADASRILQYLAGWDVSIDIAAADADSDGKVGTADASRILQYLAGWDVALGA